MFNYFFRHKKYWRRAAFLIMFLISIDKSNAQQNTITIDECHELAKANYPTIKKLDLLTKAADYTIKNANKKFLPQINFSGQATYQSLVVNYGSLFGSGALSGLNVPTFSKDQYKVIGEADQLLYDGGAAKKGNEVTTANANLSKQSVEVELYNLQDRINALYFSILLIDAQLAQNELNKANLLTQMTKTQAKLNNGTAYQSDVNELKAEVEDVNMSSIEYRANKTGYLRMLSIFIGKNIDSSSQLVTPVTTTYSMDINRPELKTYDLQKKVYDAQEAQLIANYLPTVSAFFQGAYGRPTLNALSNNFGAWYITGVKFNWSLGSLYTNKNQRAIYRFNRQSVDADKAAFLQNVKMDLAQQDEDVKKYTTLISEDDKTIQLRASVTQSASAQLANGVITTHEYIQKVNTENMARQNLNLHRIELLQTQYNIKFKSGN